jgi:hypothetical protein
LKTHRIELQRVKSMNHRHGLIEARIDALVQSAPPARGTEDDDAQPGSVLAMTEETARVLLLLIKGQLAELDARKPRSRRG